MFLLRWLRTPSAVMKASRQARNFGSIPSWLLYCPATKVCHVFSSILQSSCWATKSNPNSGLFALFGHPTNKSWGISHAFSFLKIISKSCSLVWTYCCVTVHPLENIVVVWVWLTTVKLPYRHLCEVFISPNVKLIRFGSRVICDCGSLQLFL